MPPRSGGFDGASQRFIHSRLPAGTHCLVAGENIRVYAEGDRLLDRRFLWSTLSSPAPDGRFEQATRQNLAGGLGLGKIIGGPFGHLRVLPSAPICAESFGDESAEGGMSDKCL